MTPETLIALIGSVLASIPGLYGIFLLSGRKRKDRADAAAIISEAATGLITPLEERIDRLELIIQEQAVKITNLQVTVESQQKTIAKQAERIYHLESENGRLRNKLGKLRG